MTGQSKRPQAIDERKRVMACAPRSPYTHACRPEPEKVVRQRSGARRPDVLRTSSWLVDYPFAERLYPDALGAVKHVQQWGTAVILSDGDAVFQPRKVEQSGLWHAFDNRVLIYVHKEQELDDVERFYPADHYVLIDDKLRILAAVKKIWGERVTTVFPKQGHYAHDPKILAEFPPADLELAKIGDLITCDLSSRLLQ